MKSRCLRSTPPQRCLSAKASSPSLDSAPCQEKARPCLRRERIPSRSRLPSARSTCRRRVQCSPGTRRHATAASGPRPQSGEPSRAADANSNARAMCGQPLGSKRRASERFFNRPRRNRATTAARTAARTAWRSDLGESPGDVDDEPATELTTARVSLIGSSEKLGLRRSAHGCSTDPRTPELRGLSGRAIRRCGVCAVACLSRPARSSTAGRWGAAFMNQPRSGPASRRENAGLAVFLLADTPSWRARPSALKSLSVWTGFLVAKSSTSASRIFLAIRAASPEGGTQRARSLAIRVRAQLSGAALRCSRAMRARTGAGGAVRGRMAHCGGL